MGKLNWIAKPCESIKPRITYWINSEKQVIANILATMFSIFYYSFIKNIFISNFQLKYKVWIKC